MPDLRAVCAELQSIVLPYAVKLDVKTNTDTELHVDTRHMQKNRKVLFFGAVKVGKKYVSFHLMPVYVDPSLLEGTSKELRKRMQGKSCFNFADIDRPLFDELAALTRAGFARCQEQGFV